MKRQRCDDCGKRDGDRAPDGRILLVFQPGMEGDPKLCAPCIDARRPTILDLAKAQGLWKLESLAQSYPWLKDAPYGGPPAFVDPLEQLEFGRMRDDPVAFIENGLGVRLEPWQREMCRRFGRDDPWVKKNVLRVEGRVLEQEARRG